ncbi:MAG: HupE/UreJ family protein, partial [Planctomycetota bacterium]|nr:HupE/UreJ family protein [Planctomycetota bacterium]
TIDGRPYRLVYAGVPRKVIPAPSSGAFWQCAFTLDPIAIVPFGAATWRCDLDLPEYYLVMAIAAPGQEDFQWLEGRATSREFLAQPAKASVGSSIFGRYVIIGLEHIVPGGLDHVLFVLGLYLMRSTWRQLLAQVTAFTLAHSITLGLSLSSVVAVPSGVVEPLIAMSIVLVAVENLLVKTFRPRRVAMVFGFGLFHGLGFAGALGEVGVPQAHFLPALVGFNLGVELGQLVVLLGAFACVGWWSARQPWYRARVAMPACMVIALVASYWTVERVFESLGQRV